MRTAVRRTFLAGSLGAVLLATSACVPPGTVTSLTHKVIGDNGWEICVRPDDQKQYGDKQCGQIDVSDVKPCGVKKHYPDCTNHADDYDPTDRP